MSITVDNLLDSNIQQYSKQTLTINFEKMIARKFFTLITLAVIIGFSGCEPKYEELSSFKTPDAAKVDFTITPVGEFGVKVINTSQINGIASWNFGNGNTGKGDTVLTQYNLKGTYDITLSIFTKGGSATVTKQYVQTTDNLVLLLSERVIMLVGTVDDPAGKTWVIDNEARGHFGVGPGDNMDNPTSWTSVDPIIPLFSVWWVAGPNEKANWDCYDDELNFSFVDNTFKCIFKTNARSFGRKEGVATHSSFYTDVQHTDDAYDRTFVYADAIDGLQSSWEPSEDAGRLYITFKGDKPIYPMYDINSADQKYRVAYINDHQLVLIGKDADDGSARLFILKRKGYIKPEPTFNLSATTAAGENTYDISLTDVDFPGGSSITKVEVEFGDGETDQSTDYTHVFNHQFVHKGNYTVIFKVTTGLGAVITKTITINVANNISTYVPYLLNAMVMYNDFGETILAQVGGQDCDVFVTDNPDKTMYPNRSSMVAKYTKSNQQWANANMVLPLSRRFDIRQQSMFRLLVYGTAGDVVLLKLENTDKGGDAWQTGTEKTYTIQTTNKWEIAEFDFDGADVQPGAEGWKWWPEPVSYDVKADPFYNHDWYNVIRIMLNPGNGSGTHSFYFDDLAGPHVEGLK